MTTQQGPFNPLVKPNGVNHLLGQLHTAVVQGGYVETSGPQPSCFSGLSVDQAQQGCNSLGNQCAGFSYALDGSGAGCYKGDLKGGMRTIGSYNGYIKLPQQ